jgi:hypothetical protein
LAVGKDTVSRVWQKVKAEDATAVDANVCRRSWQRYRVASAVPPPTRVDSTTGEMRLARASLLAPLQRARSVSPLGRLLFDDTNPTDASCAKKRCRGKASSCGGLIRPPDCSTALYSYGLAIAKSVGRGEGSSGPAYERDRLVLRHSDYDLCSRVTVFLG